MSKRSGSFTFTFNRRNQDVKELLERKQKNDKYFIRTDYMCEAVRFYEAFRNNALIDSNLSTDSLRTLLVSMVNKSVEKEEDKNIIHTSMNFSGVSDEDLGDD